MFEGLQTTIYESGLWRRLFKSNAEAQHWADAIDQIVAWHHGERFYHFPPPTDAEKETRFDEQKNALLTFIRAEIRHATFLRDLRLRSDSFEHLRVADIGSGPIPNLILFQNCERFCIDPLLGAYRWYGFPLQEFESSVHWINAKAEHIPVDDHFFDVVLSRDALDHVDDFAETAAEIRRVLKPGGWLHVAVNCHEPTSSEPLRLDDETVQRHFAGLGLRKVEEQPGAWGFRNGKTALWSNLPNDRLA